MNDINQNIAQFIDNIFETLTPEEQVLYWATSNSIPGYPMSASKLRRVLRASKNPKKSCYFSTSTIVPAEDGKLYNRQGLFSRMFCVVLDDIGTGAGAKCKVSDLPETMQTDYSWCIESSPGNFQYGFVFDEPIDDLRVATLFVSEVYRAGKWDSGGATPNKLVRLPLGVNLKEKYMTDDGTHFDLYEAADPELFDAEPFNTFSPAEILELVGATASWDDILAHRVDKIGSLKAKGATAYRSGVYHSNLKGVVDPVLEWLNKNDYIVDESAQGNDWITIKCPLGDNHSEGTDNTAGYLPLGVGDRPDSRAFSCFHSCKEAFRTSEFLQWVAEMGGPLVGIVDPVPGLVAEWAYDAGASMWISMAEDGGNIMMPDRDFKIIQAGDVFWERAPGKPAKASRYSLILKDPHLLKFMSNEYIPGEPEIIVAGKYRKRNMWSMPSWTNPSAADPDGHWLKFKNFIEYLMPMQSDSEWFLDHLAAKAQNSKYRGLGVVLTTPAQGTGRGTLCGLISLLWGAKNSQAVGFNELILGLNGEKFNDFLLKMWVTVSELKVNDLKNSVDPYEVLKTGLDPAPTDHLINVKYGMQRERTVYSSYILCSNNDDSIRIPSTDRRILKILCTSRPETPEFFTDITEWSRKPELWAPKVWAGLLARDISEFNGSAPVSTQRVGDAREEAILRLSTDQALTRLVNVATLFASEHCDGLLHTVSVVEWVKKYQVHLLGHGFNYDAWTNMLQKLLSNTSSEVRVGGKRTSYKVDGRKCYIRHVLNTKGYAVNDRLCAEWDSSYVKDQVHEKTAEDFKDFALELFNEGQVILN